jgi:replication factor C small subunit
MEELWTEKYRPRRLNEVVGQPSIVQRLQTLLERRALPHCLFVGSAGVGKTTCALALARELFGESWHSNFLELNASDERGIDTVRNKVKDFARTMAVGGGFKIVYLDEADALTKDAQHALRRVMEMFSDGCRFILAVNYSSRIIAPIQSRCAIFKFGPLKAQDATAFLKRIAAGENLSADDAALNAIYDVTSGDMRRAINLLQSSSIDGCVSRERILELSTKDPERVTRMLDAALAGKFKEAREVLLALLAELSGEDIIKELHTQVFELKLPDDRKIALIERVGECEFRLVEGCDPRVQLEALLANIAVAGKK